MNIILLGAPGAGKGTQAKKLAERFNLSLVGTGDMFRRALSNKTPLGLKAKEYMNKGALVPDELVFEIIQDNLSQDDWERGLLFDGFPRTLAQAEKLDTMLAEQNNKIDRVLYIEVPDSILIDRLVNRWMCGNCNKIYNPETMPSDRRCSACGGELTKRADDTPETVQKRLIEYKEKTEPIITYYKGRNGLFERIDGSLTIQQVFERLRKACESTHAPQQT
ncbi:MAG: adenylate kinase [Elusimicrobia bacterium]|nr:adenylate kinase [Elusimicrobiota bacterium]MBD3412635.1 adenylate kinase [Elusimicrobiota bacterium]